MNKVLGTFLLSLLLLPGASLEVHASSSQQLQSALSGNAFLVSYREGGPVYGTYYFYLTHYCPSGKYFTYARSVKQTVLGAEQVNNWQIFGTWKVSAGQGGVGVLYRDSQGGEQWVPITILPNGGLYAGDGISITLQGRAECLGM